MTRWRVKITATGQKRVLPPHQSKHTMKCLLMDKCTFGWYFLQDPTSAAPAPNKCVIYTYWWSSLRSWHINYLLLLFWLLHAEFFNLFWFISVPQDKSAVSLVNIKIWVSKEKKRRKKITKEGQRKNPPAGNQHPRSAGFQTNIMLTIFWPFGVCCFCLWQSTQKKPRKKCPNMVLRV